MRAPNLSLGDDGRTYETSCAIVQERKSSNSNQCLPLANFLIVSKRKCCSISSQQAYGHSNPFATTSAFILTIHTLFILSLITHQSYGALSRCDFDRYHTGCFSQANFVCDPETNYCRCQLETPILIDGRFCVAKSKANGYCQYNQQCDNSNGYHCSYLDPNENQNNRFRLCPHDPQSRYQAPSLASSSFASPSTNFEPHAKCRCLKVFEAGETVASQGAAIVRERQTADGLRPSFRGSVNFAPHNSWSNSQEKHQHSDDNNKQTHSPNFHHNHHHHSGGSILPRLVWIFLIITLLLLIALLFLIKFQSYRTDRPFHQAEDRRSINSEPDVPPPYEVAIRMKL